MSRKVGTRTFACAECKSTVTMQTSNHRRYCSEECARAVRGRSRPRFVVRTLERGEAIPSGNPLRYRTSQGYIMLRWTMSDGTFVAVMEHRVFSGHNSKAEHVHHINHVRDDNRPENLMEVTVAEHQAIHRQEDRKRHQQMKAMYERGHSTVEVAAAFGTNTGNVYRAISSLGTRVRKTSDYASPLPVEEIISRYSSGEGAGAISRDIGASYKRVIRALEQNGIQRRPVGRVPRKDVAA